MEQDVPVVLGCELICGMDHEVTLAADERPVLAAEQYCWCILPSSGGTVRA